MTRVAADPVLLLVAGLVIDALFGDMPAIFRYVPHPVVLAGRAIAFFDRKLNRETRSEASRRERGIVMVLVLVGGAALIGADGRLIGIGSLHVQHASGRELRRDVNMVVPIELLPPILDDMLTYGRPNRPPRPWLGLYAAEVEDAIVVAGLAEKGPAGKAGLRPGDRILAVRDDPVASLAGLWRKVWALGPAGSEVVMQVVREDETLTVRILSTDRTRFLKTPKLH